MVRAWYMDENTSNLQNLHHQVPPKFITLEDLYKISGLEYHQIEKGETSEYLDSLKKERGNVHELSIDNASGSDLKAFAEEHIHTDDEFYLVLQGCAFFDVRSKFEEWIRVDLLPGDLIIVPGGCYHRFIVDQAGQFKGKRFMKNAVYQAHARPCEDLNCRKDYVKKLHNGEYDKPSED